MRSRSKKLKIKPDDLDALLARAIAYFRLGDNQRSLDDIQVRDCEEARIRSCQSLQDHRTRPAWQEIDALAELEKLQQGGGPESSAISLAAVLAAELGEGTKKAFETLEAAIKKQPKNAGLRMPPPEPVPWHQVQFPARTSQ